MHNTPVLVAIEIYFRLHSSEGLCASYVYTGPALEGQA